MAGVQQRRAEVGFAREIVTPDDGPLGVRLLQQGLGSLRGAIGTPDQVADLIERYEAAGVDQVIFVSQAGPNRHEHICESLELFAAEVLPRFAERAAERERDKVERLAGAVERALARRAPPRAAGSGLCRQAPTASQRPPHADLHAARRDGAPERRLSPASWSRARARRFSPGWFAVAATSSSTACSTAGPALAVIFKGMERAFVAGAGEGFEGEIRYELRGRDGAQSWTVRIGDGRAAVRRGAGAEPAVTLRTSVPDFVRLAAREAFPPKLLLEGALRDRGRLRPRRPLGRDVRRAPPT